MLRVIFKFILKLKIDTMGREGWRFARDRLTCYGKSIGVSHSQIMEKMRQMGSLG